MIKKLKKAFTITELVIVIAVIAILAAVLIPTFSNVIKNANESAAMQNCRNAFGDYPTETDRSGLVASEGKGLSKDIFYVYLNGGITKIGTVDDLTSVGGTIAAQTYTFTVSSKTNENAELTNANGVHQIKVENTLINDGNTLAIYYNEKAIEVNGTWYVSVFLYQPYSGNETNGTNFYSTAYIYSGTYFTFDKDPGTVVISDGSVNAGTEDSSSASDDSQGNTDDSSTDVDNG